MNDKLSKAIITTIVIFGVSIPLGFAIKNAKPNKEIEAETKIEYVVSFNDGDQNLGFSKVKKDGYFSIVNPTKDGYTFIGWSTDKDGNNIVDLATTPITGDITFYAIFKHIEYDLILRNADGDEIGTIKRATGYIPLKEIEFDGLIEEKEGYTFAGFSLTPDGELLTADSIIDLTANVTLYARYNINQYTVTLNNEDGSELESLTINHGTTLSEATANVTVPTKEDYEFEGWIDNNGNVIASTTIITSDMTLSAKYKQVVFTFKFYQSFNGDYLIASRKVNLNEKVTDLPPLYYAGSNTFVGYYARSTDGELVPVAEIVATEDTNLYAYFVNKYTGKYEQTNITHYGYDNLTLPDYINVTYDNNQYVVAIGDITCTGTLQQGINTADIFHNNDLDIDCRITIRINDSGVSVDYMKWNGSSNTTIAVANYTFSDYLTDQLYYE